ncbi:MAG: hypothetical protein HGB32_04490 [Geobacteraceae bacterium]|nr:hypothetical protein [Geobacteraceae bacterium]NTW79386.1 hypothetical protein [Geobacteraceae bacterium]
MRKAFSETLTRLAVEDPHIAFITGDLGFQVFDEFEKRFGPRYINAGVAEAQMIYTAAGMASEGWKTVAYSIASFATARPFEQIRYCVAYPNLPVILVGAGRGYLYSTSGVSHHAADDLALMTALPNMTVVAPGDPGEIEQLLPQLFALGGPSYFTVGRFGEPSYEALEPAVLGKARLLREGEKIVIIGTGEIANEILKAHADLATEGINPCVYQMHTVKPLDTATLDSLSQRFDSMIIVEEHIPTGGLWSAVADWKVRSNNKCKLSRLGAPDKFALGNLKQAELRKRWGFDAEGIARECRELWQKGSKVASTVIQDSLLLDEDAFCNQMGCSVKDIPASCIRMLNDRKLKFRHISQQERDLHILQIVQRLDDLKKRPTAENQTVFQNGWHENYERSLSEGVSWESLKPKYIKPFQYTSYMGDFIAPETPDFVDELFSIVLTNAFEKYLGSIDNIYEFGCGTGRYLYMLSKIFPEKSLVGLDWTDASVNILGLMRQQGIKIEGNKFDMLNPESGFTLKPNSAVLTISSMEQLGGDYQPFLSYILAAKPRIVLHHEPIEEFYDTAKLLDHLAATYHRRRGYLSGYWPALQQLAAEGKVEILEAHRTNFGDPYHDGASIIAWRPKG